MRASSWVSRSNRRNIFSISLSPNNFFANCSVNSSEIVIDRQGGGLLTESSVLNLLLRLAEDGKQLNHDLCYNLRHQSA